MTGRVVVWTLRLCASPALTPGGLIARAVQNAEREDERWERIEREKAEEEAKWQAVREKGEKARRNHNSVPYNPLTLAYNETDEGKRLRHADDLIRWRAAQRAKNLQVCAVCHAPACMLAAATGLLSGPYRVP